MRSPCSPTTTDMDVSSNGSSNDVGSARTCFLQYDVECEIIYTIRKEEQDYARVEYTKGNTDRCVGVQLKRQFGGSSGTDGNVLFRVEGGLRKCCYKNRKQRRGESKKKRIRKNYLFIHTYCSLKQLPSREV